MGLFLWNLRTMLDFEQQGPPAEPPAQRLRQPAPGADLTLGWPRDPVITSTLGQLDWDGVLVKHPGWTFDTVRGGLRCEDGRALTPTDVRPAAHAGRRTGIIFQRPTGGCRDCDAPAECLHYYRQRAPKRVELSVPGL